MVAQRQQDTGRDEPAVPVIYLSQLLGSPIRDERGEKVATLVSGTMDVGQHSVLFNANGLKNGVYYYRLTAGKYSQTASVIVAH